MPLKLLVFLLFLALFAFPAHADTNTTNTTNSTNTTLIVGRLDRWDIVLEESGFVAEYFADGWSLFFQNKECHDYWWNLSWINQSYYNNQTNQTEWNNIFRPIPPSSPAFPQIMDKTACRNHNPYYMYFGVPDNATAAELAQQLYTVDASACTDPYAPCELKVRVNNTVLRRLQKYEPQIYITITKGLFDGMAKARDAALEESKTLSIETAGCKASMQDAKNLAVTAQQEKEQAKQDLVNERTIQSARVDSCMASLNASAMFASTAFLNGTAQGYTDGYAIGSNQSSSQRFWQQVGLGLVVGGIVFSSYARYRKQRYYLPGVS